MSYNPDLNRQYLSIRGMYDSGFNKPNVGGYNALKGSIYNFKSSNCLPNDTYNAVNKMQQNYGTQLGGLEKKLY